MLPRKKPLKREGPSQEREAKPRAKGLLKTFVDAVKTVFTEPTEETPEKEPAGGFQRKPGKCKHCKGRLDRLGEVIHPDCVDGWLAANRPKLERAKAKAERANVKVRRERLKTIADRIAEAQIEFNKFIRERDKDKGCFVCGRAFDPNIPGRALHAGHVRSRGAAGHLRFVEDNCMGECEGCNGPHGAKPHQIKEGAIRRIGAERFAELENDNTPHKWTHEELIALKLHYRAKHKELLKGASHD